jgi:Kef-type K+ transport system membrane component KefB
LLFAWIAHSLGAPELLGGFAAGLALSRQFFFPFGAFLHQTPEFSSRVEEQMKPIIHLFTPIFFVAIGLSLDLKSVEWGSNLIWLLTGFLLLVATLGKLLSGFLLRGETLVDKLVVGTSMVPRGEVGLIFANVALTAKVFQNSIYASVILVISLTTLLAPFFIQFIYDHLDHRKKSKKIKNYP